MAEPLDEVDGRPWFTLKQAAVQSGQYIGALSLQATLLIGAAIFTSIGANATEVQHEYDKFDGNFTYFVIGDEVGGVMIFGCHDHSLNDRSLNLSFQPGPYDRNSFNYEDDGGGYAKVRFYFDDEEVVHDDKWLIAEDTKHRGPPLIGPGPDDLSRMFLQTMVIKQKITLRFPVWHDEPAIARIIFPTDFHAVVDEVAAACGWALVDDQWVAKPF